MIPARWKRACAALLFIALAVGVRVGLWAASSSLDEHSVIRSSVVGVLTLVAIVWATVWLQRRRPDWTAPELVVVPRWTTATFQGALLACVAGSALFGSVFIGVLLMGGLGDAALIASPSELAAIGGAALLATALGAAWEELVFRGWAFSVCVKAFGPHRVAVSLGVVFGLMHMLNPNWTVAAIVSVALAGLLLSYTMLAFRNIAVAFGLHLGWNFCQSMLTSHRLWTRAKHPDPLLSGGSFGLEATWPGIVLTGLAAAFVIALFVRRARRSAQPKRHDP